MALSTSALVTVEEAMSWLRQSFTVGSEDYLRLERLVNYLSDAFRAWLDRPIVKEAFDEEYDGTGDDTLFLNNYPVIAVTSLKVWADSSYLLQYDLAANDYFVYKQEGKIVLNPNNTKILQFPPIYRAVRVQYEAGLGADRDSIPLGIKQACLEAIRFFWKDEELPTQAFGERPLVVIRRLPQSVQELLSPFFKMTFGVI